jgi:hypothetical protein
LGDENQAHTKNDEKDEKWRKMCWSFGINNINDKNDEWEVGLLVGQANKRHCQPLKVAFNVQVLGVM